MFGSCLLKSFVTAAVILLAAAISPSENVVMEYYTDASFEYITVSASRNPSHLFLFSFLVA